MTPPPRSQANSWLFICILGYIAALTPLAIDMYLPAMPTIADAYGVDASAVQYTLSVFTMGFAFGQLIVGAISDAIGRKPVMLFGVFIFTITSILCAYAEDISGLSFWRIFQGIAGASSGVMISAMVKDLFDRDQFSRIMSFIVLVMTLAPLVAPLMGGYIALWFGWRAIFWALALMGVAAIVIVMTSVDETLIPELRQRVSVRQTLASYAKMLSSPESLALLICGAMSFACLFSFLVSASFVYMEEYGIALENVGYLFAFNIVALMIITSINGRKVMLKGAPYMMRVGLTIQFVGAVLLLPSLYWDHSIWLVVLPCMLVLGATSMVGSNLMALFLSKHHTIAGSASSLVGSFRFGVGSLVGALSTTMPFSVQLNMVLAIIVSAALSMFFFRYYRRELKRLKA